MTREIIRMLTAIDERRLAWCPVTFTWWIDRSRVASARVSQLRSRGLIVGRGESVALSVVGAAILREARIAALRRAAAELGSTAFDRTAVVAGVPAGDAS